jgi:hypothetical protein
VAKTIETVTFRLKEGVDEQRFLEENWKVEDNFVRKQPGLITRETALGDDGEVLVVLHWERPEDAQGSMDKFPTAPETQDFLALIDTDTFTMTRYRGQDKPT